MTSELETQTETKTRGDRSASSHSPIRHWREIIIDKRWPISVVAIYAATVVLSSMDRFFTWDEAVFWSQSGGFDGTSVEPAPLVASRELGSSLLIGLLRLVENDLAEVRFLWATLAFFLLVWGARRLVRYIGDRGALIFLWVYGTHWLVLAWTPSFYSYVIAANLALLAATSYLDLLNEQGKGLWDAVLLGLFIAATFAMRPLEAALVILGMAVHFFAMNWPKVRQLFGRVSLSTLVVLMVVGIPWALDSINRFGSVASRIEAGLSQGGQVASGLRSNVIEYLGVLSGDRLIGAVPYWTRFVVFGVASVAACVIVAAIAKQGRRSMRGAPGLFIVLSATNASFFLFWRDALEERYFFFTMIFAAAAFGWALNKLLGPPPGGVAVWAMASIAVIWLVTQVVAVTAYEEHRDVISERSARVAATMRTLSNEMPCEAITRYGSPVINIASGCRAAPYYDWDSALSFAADNPEATPQFIYGPAFEGHFEDLPDGWIVVSNEDYRLAYWLPTSETSSG